MHMTEVRQHSGGISSTKRKPRAHGTLDEKDLSQAEVLITKMTLGNVLPPEVYRAYPMVLEPRRVATAAKAVIRGSIA